MPAVPSKRSFVPVAIAVLLATQALFWPWSHWVTSPLLDVPVPMDRAIAVERSMRIPIGEPYQLSLMFPRRGPQGDRRELLACDGGIDAIRLPVRWSLMTTTGATAAAGNAVQRLCAGSWSSDFVWTTLANMRVPPGRYRFRATVGPWPASAGRLGGASPRLLLAMHGGKAWSSWQLSAVYLGVLASVYLVWPLLALLALAWLWRSLFPCRRGQLSAAPSSTHTGRTWRR